MNIQPTYEQLLAENTILREENQMLKQQLGLSSVPTHDPQPLPIERSVPSQSTGNINKSSNREDKLDFFMSLFAGRADVYARRWQSKNQKSGYSPVCEHEWVRGICNKPKIKCAQCANRQLLPLTKEVIFRHMMGNDPNCGDVIGVYPMLTDETCNFLVADFDDGDWQEDVRAFREICRNYGLSIAVERSRSGNGGHVWFFFSEPISCSTARRMATSLLTLAMEKRHDIQFKSYDRLLPNQDTMPSGGFGNLIALPLQGRSAKNGNSLFLDDNFEPYDDQLEYLSSLRKIQAKAIENFLSELHVSELGLLLATDEEIAKPWEKKTVPLALTAIDFPQELQLVRANGIHIAKTGCSERALNRIKRLAAFKNPEFYKAQAMRLATYDKPRIIDTSYENNEYLSIPRGCEEGLLELLDGANVAYNIEDKRTQGSAIKVSFNGTLRDEQAIAAKQLLKCDNGILSATTAFGKTIVGAYVIAEKKVNALILVHTSALLEQWKKSLLQFLTIEELPTEQPKGHRKKLSIIGQLGSSKNTLSGKIDIAIIQSLVNGDEVKELIKDYGLVIVDECHHVSAVSFERVLKAVNAKYVYGLTATPTRQDGQQAIIYMQCGKIRYKVDAKTQAEGSGFERFVVPRFSSLRKPISITDKDIVKLYGIIVSDVQRNAMIVSDIVNALKKGRTPIVLTGRWAHVALLADELEKVCPNIIRLTGKTPAKEKREALERLQAIPQGEPFVIVATGKYVGEGFDEPRLDTLFLVSPIAWKGTLQQYAGRLHREYEGKESVIIYDYVDMHIKPLERMYHKRVSAYFGMGYKSLNENKSSEQVGVIFDNKSFQPVCEKDIHAAKHEIVVASPFLRKNRVQQMMRLFSAAQINGVKIIVATRPAENYKLAEQPNILPLIETLSVSGIQVVEKLNLHQRFAVIDQNIVWYGSINLLAYGTTDESIMRFENADIAGELLDILI